MLTVCCVINTIFAIYFASNGSYYALFSIFMAAWCGIWTYHPKYQHQDAKDINDGREK